MFNRWKLDFPFSANLPTGKNENCVGKTPNGNTQGVNVQIINLPNVSNESRSYNPKNKEGLS